MDIAPPSVNLSPLDAILARAKSVMSVTDSTKPIVLSENTQKEIELEELAEINNPEPRQMTGPKGYTNEQVMASNLPASVKEAMMNKRIPLADEFPQSLVKEDFSELEDIKMIPNKRAPILKQTPKQVVNENLNQLRNLNSTPNSDMITVSKSELKTMINEAIVTFLAQSYNKTLSEEVIKKTMNILIKEGKLNLRKPTIK